MKEYNKNDILKYFAVKTDSGKELPADLQDLPESRIICKFTLQDTNTGNPQQHPSYIDITWKFPIHNVSGMWHPTCQTDRSLKADFTKPLSSMAARSAPVLCLYDAAGENRLAFALSEIEKPVIYSCYVHEEDGTFVPKIRIDIQNIRHTEAYTFLLYLDFEKKPYYKALKQISQWWQGLAGNAPMEVPASAREPFYSTWYAYHQGISADAIEKECQMAYSLGCRAVIVDDGWQGEDGNRGYAFCGDWEVSKRKFPDMKQHVYRIHAIGMKYMLWLSVPYVGKKAKAWERFSCKLLCYNEEQQAGILDIRYPEVREYLIHTYERLLLDYDLDGFKLDFIDEFYLRKDSPAPNSQMDFICVQEALSCLMAGIKNRLSAKKPDILIEFRQKYVGPHMRKFGNIFRVSDCPMAMDTNRTGIIDIRLLSGNTAVHSDMLMWHHGESVVAAALHIQHSLFSTLQISVQLGKLPKNHREMIAFWLKFIDRHRRTLQQAELLPYDPQQLYPLVIAQTPLTESKKRKEQIAAVYQPGKIIPYDARYPNLYLVNATRKEKLLLHISMPVCADLLCYDCTGKIIWKKTKQELASDQEMPVPSAGLLKITAYRLHSKEDMA